MLYFAYGSNMLTRRLQKRVPSAEPVSRALLKDYGLRFHKKSTDGSGKCDIIESQGETVYGVLFEMDPHEFPKLNKAEGLGQGYHHIQFNVELPGRFLVRMMQLVVSAALDRLKLPHESPETALAYAADTSHVDPSLKPWDWYLQLVLAGAREHGLPADSIARLESIQFNVDPVEERPSRLEALELLSLG